MEDKVSKPSQIPIAGTWKLITGMIIEKGDTVVTDYTKNRSFIKIINDTHFAFLQHDLNKGKDSAAVLWQEEADIHLATVYIPNIWNIAVPGSGRAMIFHLQWTL